MCYYPQIILTEVKMLPPLLFLSAAIVALCLILAVVVPLIHQVTSSIPA